MTNDRTKKTHATKKASASYPSSASSPSYPQGFIPPHGGYEKLLAYRKSQIIYDATVRFCDRFIDKRSRTHDQMVQAAPSGNKNIAEGSQVSGMVYTIGNPRMAVGSMNDMRKHMAWRTGTPDWGPMKDDEDWINRTPFLSLPTMFPDKEFAQRLNQASNAR